MRAGDQLAAEVRALPWIKVEKSGRTVRVCHACERFSIIGGEPSRHTPAQESHVISSFGNNSPARRVTNQKHLVVLYINDTIGGRHIIPIEV